MSYHELDLSNWGRREIRMMQDLLKAHAQNNRTVIFSGIEKIAFNQMSGYVFLMDADMNVAVEENGVLVDFVSCPYCGNEGIISEVKDGDDCCKEFLKDIEE